MPMMIAMLYQISVRAALLALAASFSLPLLAQEAALADSEAPVRRYLVGAALSSSQSHIGSDERELGLQPILGFWVGRYRLSTGRASSLWNVGRATVVDPGLSTTLLSKSDWSLGASLIHSFKKSAEDIDTTAAAKATQNSTAAAAKGDPIRAPNWAFSAARIGIPTPATNITAP